MRYLLNLAKLHSGMSVKRFLFSSLVLFFLIPGTLLAQRDTLRTNFLDAESWFLFEEYAEALPLYMKLHRADPENDNIKYKIGICLLNDPYQKEKSIGYLLEASENIDPDYKENNFKERSAPPDVLYFLGNAYLVNQQLQKAIDTYQRFLEIMDPEVYDRQLVDAQIRACKNAQRLRQMPVDIDLHLLDSLINTRYADIRPVVSGDGTKMAFVTELPFYDGAFYTEKLDGEWSYPRNITPELGFDADVYPTCLSYDGTEMILYYDEDYIGNLYHSRFEDGRWLPAEKLGENISTKYWESHACFSKDGQTLYFTSNRKGTHGGLDIYRSERQADGTWGVPENLGPTINTRYNEMSPFITEDGQTLYFSSYGHFSIGGYDVFYSRRNRDGSWGKPVNLGYPLNTTDDDLYYHPVNKGSGAYYSMYNEDRGIGRHDIYYVDVYSVDNPRMYLITGNLRAEDGKIDTTQTVIYVVDAGTGDTVLYQAPQEETGAFSFNLKQGQYQIHVASPGYEPQIRPLRITPDTDKKGIRMPDDIELQLVEKEPMVFEGEESEIRLRDSIYEGLTEEILPVPLRLQKGSRLITRIYQDSVLISVDTLEVDRRRMSLELEPVAGTSRVELEMIDPDGNIHRSHFMVHGTEPEPEPLAEEVAEPEAIREEVLQPDTVGTPTEETEAAEVITEEEAGPAEEPASEEAAPGRKWWPVVLIILGIGVLLLVIIFWRRRRKEEENAA